MDLIKSAVKAVEEVNGKDIKIYETKNINPLFDYAVIATVSSGRQLDAVISHIEDEAAKEGFTIRGIEGKGGACWLLVDLYSIVIHVFTEEERRHYDLDKLWRDLPTLDVEDYKKWLRFLNHFFCYLSQ